jgi:hypothetical protein
VFFDYVARDLARSRPRWRPNQIEESNEVENRFKLGGLNHMTNEEAYNNGVAEERARCKKLLEMCRGVYERDARGERRSAQEKGMQWCLPSGPEPAGVYYSSIEKALSDKAVACEFAIWILCDWSLGPDYKPNWMPIPY